MTVFSHGANVTRRHPLDPPDFKQLRKCKAACADRQELLLLSSRVQTSATTVSPSSSKTIISGGGDVKIARSPGTPSSCTDNLGGGLGASDLATWLPSAHVLSEATAMRSGALEMVVVARGLHRDPKAHAAEPSPSHSLRPLPTRLALARAARHEEPRCPSA
eukprot:CAMPEP_0115266710 /NCGR_PEP_ID=MMETSP0270-20121206/51607_1 /TAXON_ID=71861 /ORGANISM="Scrippsiella trochoidea, Strain CCMP3099" /LENGTH=161 /DNA_ID=CAMNT_0002682813 /DNA_START=297 /DNA_END=779 /DNA_ORIENTATION=+